MNKNNIKLVCFDMDGTLYTSEGVLVPAYHNGIDKFNAKYNLNLNKPTKEELEHQIGQPVRIIFKNLFPDLNDSKKLEELAGMVMQEFLFLISKKGGRLFPNVELTLKELMNGNYLLAIASNGKENYLRQILESFEIKDFFVPLVAIDDKEIIEKSDILKKYMEDHSISKHEILMIGDRSSDFEAAQKIGCKFIGCSYGFASNEIEKADTVVKDIKEILNYI